MTKVRVLVIDDSNFNRQTICEIFESHPRFEVIATASDGQMGLKMAMSLEPDLVTLDLEMPQMDGFTFLRLVMETKPVSILVISSHSRPEDVFTALDLGAIDFVAKSEHFFPGEISRTLRDEILLKAEAAASSLKPESPVAQPTIKSTRSPDSKSSDGDPALLRRIACIGASTGGPRAVRALVEKLPRGGTSAYLIAQHMPRNFTGTFADRLDRQSAVSVVEACHGDLVRPGCVYIAPGGTHMELIESASGWQLALSEADYLDSCAPSVDRLFCSVAERYHGAALGIMLTGMGTDGRTGVEALHRAGGYVLAESEETATVFGMPKEAILSGAVNEVLALHDIVERLAKFARGEGVRCEP